MPRFKIEIPVVVTRIGDSFYDEKDGKPKKKTLEFEMRAFNYDDALDVLCYTLKNHVKDE